MSGGSRDRTVRVWRLADGTPAGEPLTGHTWEVNAVAVGALPDGTPVIVSGGADRTMRVWRLADGAPVGEPLTGHTGPVWAVAVGGLPDGTPVIVSGGDDGTVRVWRLADGAPAREPLTGHARSVEAVAVGALRDGTPVIVSGGDDIDDGTVRVWRLADGAPVGEPLTGHTGPVRSVAVGALRDGTPVIVSGGDDGTVRVWRLARRPLSPGFQVTGRPVAKLPTDPNSQVTAVAALPDGTPVIISGGAYGTVRVWRLARRLLSLGFQVTVRPVGELLTGHTGAVEAVAVGALRDGTPVIVSGGLGSWDRRVWVWRLAGRLLSLGIPVTGRPVGELLTSHTSWVTAVAMGELPDGTPVIVSGGDDGTVRAWRLPDGAPVGEPLDLSEPVKGITLRGNIIVTAAGREIAVHQLAAP